MRAGLTISSAAHAVILGWGLIHFASVKPREPQLDTLPIDLVSISELTKMRTGQTKVKTIEPVKQVEKKDEPKTIEDLTRPLKDKEVKATPPPPQAPPPAVETPPKPEKEKPEEVKETPKPVPTPPKKQAKAEPKKQPEKKIAKQKTPPVKTKHEFDPDKIATLLDRRAPSRKQNADEQKTNPTLGTPKGDSVTLSMSELDAFKRHVSSCWNVLPGAGNMERAIVELRIMLNPDGTLAAPPQVYNKPPTAGAQATAESAIRAVINCAPYKMLRANTYSAWKDMILNFDPDDMRS